MNNIKENIKVRYVEIIEKWALLWRDPWLSLERKYNN